MGKKTNYSENKSGIEPTLDRILVRPDQIEETTAGGILIPPTVLELHMAAQTSGVLIAIGPDCWSDYKGPASVIGQKVMFAKYGGQSIWGKDGVEYRVLNDVDITANIDEGVTFGIHSRKSGGVSKK